MFTLPETAPDVIHPHDLPESMRLPMPLRAVLHRGSRVATLLALVVLAACRGGGHEIVLGFAAPLNDAYGRNARDGAELAVRELAAGGVRFDSRGDPVGKRFVVGVAHGGRLQLEVASR